MSVAINRDYPCHTTNYCVGRKAAISYLVIHYVGALGSAQNNVRYYGTQPKILASAHYFVGHASEQAAVYSSVAEKDTAWHVGTKKYVHPECRNYNSIGIELCCHQDAAGAWYFDPETVERGAELAREIMQRYEIPLNHVLRHYDVTGKICPAPFVNSSAAWEAFKRRLV